MKNQVCSCKWHCGLGTLGIVNDLEIVYLYAYGYPDSAAMSWTQIRTDET